MKIATIGAMCIISSSHIAYVSNDMVKIREASSSGM